MLLDYGQDTKLEARTQMGRTALHLAAMRGFFEVATLLLRAGADVNSQDCDLNTPVHLAA